MFINHTILTLIFLLRRLFSFRPRHFETKFMVVKLEMVAIVWLQILLAIVSSINRNLVHAAQTPLKDDICSHQPYKIHIFSISPLVIYISDFLSNSEREHLIEVTWVI